MEKIQTIFNRDWEGNHGVIDQYLIDVEELKGAKATEKLDGTNVRLTIRNGNLVRLEKRRNPSKIQKKMEITEPWYVDANEYDPQDKYLWEAAKNIRISGWVEVKDGEWSGEALGPKIQDNPLNLEEHCVILFSNGDAPIFENVPTTFAGLKEWLPKQRSKFGNDCGIEGIVWHNNNGKMYKIKLKDFK